MKVATQRPLSKTTPPVKTTYVIDYGEKKEITYYEETPEIDMIVMGTHGAGNCTYMMLI